MNDKTKIQFPPLPDGATGWEIYQAVPQFETPPDNRNIYRRVLFRSLMFLHDKAESFWHWCYRKSQAYAPPKSARVNDVYKNLGNQENLDNESRKM